MSPELITGPEQGKSSGRVATFSLWTGVLWDGISSIPDEKVIPPWLHPKKQKETMKTIKETWDVEIRNGSTSGPNAW
jgi:hypothetical protein